MKKKSASQSAFFNPRVLIGLCIALAGICLALLGLDAFAASAARVKMKNNIITASNDPLVPVGFDCSKIQELGIDKMENHRAGAIMIRLRRNQREVRVPPLSAASFSHRQGFPKIAGAPVWRWGRQPDHRHRDLSQRRPVGDIHYG